MRDRLALQNSQALRSLAMEKAYDVARLIKKELPSCTVILYGSLARDGWFDQHSDIDLYVQNWSESIAYWKLLSSCQDAAFPLSVSVVTEREVLPALRQEIEREGLVIA